MGESGDGRRQTADESRTPNRETRILLSDVRFVTEPGTIFDPFVIGHISFVICH